MLDPVSPAKYLLLLWLLVASLLMGVRLTRRFIGSGEPLDVAGYALAFSTLLLGVVGSWVARIVRHFPGTFIVLGVLFSLPLLVDLARRWRSSAPAGSPGRPELPRSGPTHSPKESAAALAIGIVALVPTLNMVWGTHLWDDWYFYLPLTSAFSRNVFPVVYPFLPDRALTYHFAFAWLAGIIEYHTGLSPEHCVDVISTLFLVIFYLSAAGTFRIWVGGRVAPYAGAAVVIGFGPLSWLWMLFQSHGNSLRSWFVAWMLDSQTTFANDVARNADYLLQKPMLSGMALLWLVMSLVFVARRRHSVAGAAAAGFCVGMVELFQYPTASLATLASGAVLLLDVLLAKSLRRQKLLMLIGLFGILAVALPRVNGGFVANPQGDPIIVDYVWNFPYPGLVSWAKAHDLPTFFCYMVYYGATAFMLPFVLPSLWRQRSLNTVCMVLFAAGGFAVTHLVHHRTTPVNITKFLHLSGFALAAVSAAGVLLATRRWPPRPRAVILSLFVVAASLSTWLASTSMTAPGQPRPIVADATVQSLRSMARWLRPHAGSHDRVFALTDEVQAMSGVMSPPPTRRPRGTPGLHRHRSRLRSRIHRHGQGADRQRRRLPRRPESLSAQSPLGGPAVPTAAVSRRRSPPPTGRSRPVPLRHELPPTPTGWLIYEYLKGPSPGSLSD